MKLLRPAAITGSVLTASNVLENPPAAYNAGTAYSLGQQVSVFGGVNSTTATMYESLQAGNTGNTPSSSPSWWRAIGTAYLAWSNATAYLLGAIVTDTANHLLYEAIQAGTNKPLTDVAYWVELGPTNRWAMFDERSDTRTVRPFEVKAALEVPDRADMVSLIGIDAAEVNVTVWAGAEERTNLLRWSEDFDNAVWEKYRATASANVAVAPDGTMTADKLVENTDNNSHTLGQSATGSSSAYYTFSVYIKAAERTFAALQLSNNSTTAATIWVNLATGTITLTSAGIGDWASPTGTIEPVGGGWYRCALSALKSAVNTVVAPRVLIHNGSTTTYAGDGVSGIYVWGAQLEEGSEPTQYIKTEGSAVTVTGEEYYNEDYSLISDDGIIDWFEYYFEPPVRLTDLSVSDLPNVLDPRITITATDGDDVSISTCKVGLSAHIGDTQYGASVGQTSYSKVTRDEFGNPSIVPRGLYKSGRFQLWMAKPMVGFVYNLLSEFDAKPVVLIGADDYGPTHIHGLLKDWRIEISYPSHSVMTIEIEGL